MKYPRTGSGPALAVAAALLAGACGRPEATNPGQIPDPAMGPFTGEVKPVLYVRDVELSAPFYRDVLGFEFLGFSLMEGEPYYAEMAAGGLKFGLHNPMNDEQEGWVGHQRIYFRVWDATEQRSDVMARGGDPGELRETDWMDMFIVRDPDGHEIVFAATDSTKHSVDPW
jgi:predicted enzyme related to lactoylglutathione lyase